MIEIPKKYTLQEALRYVLRQIKYAQGEEVNGATLYYCVLIAYYYTKAQENRGGGNTLLSEIKGLCERSQHRIFKDESFGLAKALDRADSLRESENVRILRNNPVGYRLIVLADEYRKVNPKEKV